MRFRIRSTALAAVIAAIVAVVLMGAGGASATIIGPSQGVNPADPTDPQSTNVPYVAWAGEQIRFEKCYNAYDLRTAGIARDTPVIAHFNVVNPLIDTPSSVTPTWEGGGFGTSPGNAVFIGEGDGLRLCASGTYYSASPGLADILLNVTGLDGNQTVLPKHDFIGIWLRMSAPTLTELNAGGDFNPAPGATTGTGSFNLGSNGGLPVKPGVVGVSVSGTFVFGGRTWTFPGTTDWSDLAHMLATDTNPKTVSPGGAWFRWDIHDNNLLDEGHPNVAGCTPATAALSPGALDAVDNCAGGTNYSRIAGYSYSTGAGIGALGGSDVGPFDPLWSSTLLGNGVVDSSDVPMPAAQINLTLTGGAGMAGPTGALVKADKQTLFSRDGLGGTAAHNLYAPYYSQYIPATSRDIGPASVASGVDGPQLINDVSGFQTYGRYDNWDILNGIGNTGANACLDANGHPIPLAASNRDAFLSGTVYTDEHGQAEVLYDPNGGFTLTPDSNTRCISFLTGPSTFTSTISATAVYPYKKVAPAQAATPLTKTVTTASLKTLTCVPKGPFEAFCVERVLDPWGNPMAGVRVAFSTNSIANAQVQPDSAVIGSLDTRGQGVGPLDKQMQVALVETNALGMAGVAVTDSIAADCVNVRAENIETRVNGAGVSVFTDFNPALGVACNASGGGGGTGTTPTTTTTTTTATTTTATTTTATTATTTTTASSSNNSNNSSSNSSNAASNASANAAPTALPGGTPAVVTQTAKAKKKLTANITNARFVVSGKSRFLGIQLKGNAKHARVTITLIGANERVIGKVTKTVKTGKFIKVMKVGMNVKSVRLTAAGLTA